MMTQPTLFLCRICGQVKPPEGPRASNPLATAVHQHLNAALPGVAVVLTDCLSVCDRALVWGLRASGKHAFVFGWPAGKAAPAAADLAAALATQATTYASLPAGVKMGKDTFPALLKGTLVGRLPPLPE